MAALMEEVVQTLRALEQACDDLAANRSQETYRNMIDCDRATPYLDALDEARRNARSLLYGHRLAHSEPRPIAGAAEQFVQTVAGMVGDEMNAHVSTELRDAARAISAGLPPVYPSLEMCVIFSDDGHIRKWSRDPFEGGECLYSHPATHSPAPTEAGPRDEEYARELLKGAVMRRDATGASLAKHDSGEVEVGAAVDAVMIALRTTITSRTAQTEAGEVERLREAAETIAGWLKQEQDRLDAESGDYLMDTADCITVIREKAAALTTQGGAEG